MIKKAKLKVEIQGNAKEVKTGSQFKQKIKQKALRKRKD